MVLTPLGCCKTELTAEARWPNSGAVHDVGDVSNQRHIHSKFNNPNVSIKQQKSVAGQVVMYI